MSGERFFKYQGTGNDFIVLDRRQSGRDIDAETSRLLCDRHRGIGADGVLALLPDSGAMARMVVHNPDGSVAEMCGNGLRCAVKYLLDHDAGRPAKVRVATGAGVLESAVAYAAHGVDEVEVAMGPARLVAANLPSGRSGAPFVDGEVEGHRGLRGTAVSMGNPHLVLSSAPLEQAASLGPILEHHPSFPDRTNVEFVRREGNGLEVVVWERGAGLTQACGTGACAAVASYVHRGLLPADEWVPVRLPGGRLDIRVASGLVSVALKGPVRFVFEGVVPEGLGQ